MRLKTGLIGAHIGSTRLPRALNMLCHQVGAELEFVPIETADQPMFDLASTLDQFQFQGWTSVSVTHPFKTMARQYVGQTMHAEIAHLLACNTVRFEGGLAGFNTDYTGFHAAWQNTFPSALPGDVVMAGAGGVAHAIGPALRDLGATRIAIYDAQPERAILLQTAVGSCAQVLSEPDLMDALRQADGVVNATPLGMAQSPGSAFDLAALSPDRQTWAFDAVYTPLWTPFLQAARAAGLHVLTGFDLFKTMAVRTFNVCTGLELTDAEALPLLKSLHPCDEVQT